MNYFTPEFFSLKNHPTLDEKWVQERIAEKPSILGLGDLFLRDKERIQLRAGRLDLLLEDVEDDGRRYEVEIQLGATDETHIIRTLEYWDIERKRYPQLDHCAVIVAEDITSRFFNVIGLFNGHIPIIAIQMKALQVDGKIGLVFTKVLDEIQRGIPDAEVAPEATDRAYWENKASPATVKLADKLLEKINAFAPPPGYVLKFNKGYIGLAHRNGRANNFSAFKPNRSAINVEVMLPKTEETSKKIVASGAEMLSYNHSFNYYTVRLGASDIEKYSDLMVSLMKEAHDLRL